jgi:N6-adenosine-specific RNA methylase IME4
MLEPEEAENLARVLLEFSQLRPHGGFNMIVADPPWQFTLYDEETGASKAPQGQYQCMSAAWIKALPVQALAAPNCMLFLWATNPLLPLAIETVAAWGFEYKTAGTWIKRTTHGKTSFGPGYRLRSSNEPFIIATQGKVPRGKQFRSSQVSYEGIEGLGPNDWPKTHITIDAEATGHSRKPEASYDMLRDLIPAPRAVDLFSRTTRYGFTPWGNETGLFDEEGA